MASNILIDELRDILQTSSKEKINNDKFKKDLLSTLNLENDEIDRALTIMVAQARVNPEVIGSMENGSFKVSADFSSKVVATIKYENRFIEGKQEYIDYNSKVFKEGVEAGVLLFTPQIIDKMISGYKELSQSDAGKLWANFGRMTPKQQNELMNKHNEFLEEQENNTGLPEDVRKNIGEAKKSNRVAQNNLNKAREGSKFALTVIKQQLSQFYRDNPTLTNILRYHGDVNISNLDLAQTIDEYQVILSVVAQQQKAYAEGRQLEEVYIERKEGQLKFDIKEGEDGVFYECNVGNGKAPIRISAKDLNNIIILPQVEKTPEIEALRSKPIVDILADYSGQRLEDIGTCVLDAIKRVKENDTVIEDVATFVSELGLIIGENEEIEDEVYEDVIECIEKISPHLFSVMANFDMEECQIAFEEALGAVKTLTNEDKLSKIQDSEVNNVVLNSKDRIYVDPNFIFKQNAIEQYTNFENKTPKKNNYSYEDIAKDAIAQKETFAKLFSGAKETSDSKKNNEVAENEDKKDQDADEKKEKSFSRKGIFDPKKATESKAFKGVRFGIVKEAHEAIKQLFTRDREETEQGLGENE